MGGAMLAGWLRGGMAPGRFTVVDPVLAEAPAGVELLRELPAADRFDAVLLGVKPQLWGGLAPQLAPVAKGAVVLSLLAGVELASLAAGLPGAAGHVRIMPNLAAAIGKSAIGMVARGLDEAGQARVKALLAPLGTPEWLAREADLDVVTALVGSGPAFVYRFIDALGAAAGELGLPAEQAERLALAMVEGAALLAAQAPHSPGELARRVASPKGTTEAGLNVLDAEAALARLVTATLAAAKRRSEELAAATRAP